MPVKKEREYRTLVAPLAAQSSGEKRLQSECYVEGQARTYLGLDTVGVAEFFALLYIAYEVVSIFKNMALCGLPVKKVWEKVREFLAKYTDELPDTDELDGDSTTGSVEEHRTQER